MTQAVVQVRNIVARSGFANPLTLEVLVSDEDYVKVYADTTLLDNGPDYEITGIGDPNGISIEIIGAEDVDSYLGVISFVAVYEPPLDQQGDLSAGGVLGRAFETALDQQNRRLQSIGDRVLRSLKVDVNIDGDIVLNPVDGQMPIWNEDEQRFDFIESVPSSQAVAAAAAAAASAADADAYATAAAASAADADADATAAAASAVAAALAKTAAELAEVNAEAAQAAAEAAAALALPKAGGTMTGPIGFTHQASPANPAAGVLALFAKNDNRFYSRTSAGVEAPIGSGVFTNVKDYGAVGDDATDNHTAFQAAIDATLAAGGGTVFVPRGKYWFSNAVPATSLNPGYGDLVFLGEGDGSVLHYNEGTGTAVTDPTAHALFKNIANVSKGALRFESLKFAGTMTASPGRRGGCPAWLDYYDSVVFHHCLFQDIANVAMDIHYCGEFETTGCRFLDIAADCVRARDTPNCYVAGNYIQRCGDDPIALHMSSGYTPVRRGLVITGNNIVNASGRIVALGSQRVVITHNTCYLSGTINVGDTQEVEGALPVRDILIAGNILDSTRSINTVTGVPQSGLSTGILVSGVAPRGATVTHSTIPGQWDATAGAFVYPWTYDEVDTRSASNPVYPAAGVVITGNILRRTVKAVAAFSSYGVGTVLGQGVAYDPAITDANLRQNVGVFINVPGLRGGVIANNVIESWNYGISFAASTVDYSFDRVSVRGNAISNCLISGVEITGAAFYAGIEIADNLIDCDPYRQYSNSNANGTYTASSAPFGVRLGTTKGAVVRRNTMKNCCVMVQANTPTNHLIDDNLGFCALPAAHGFNTGNKGIGDVQLAGSSYRFAVIDADPTSATYGALTTMQYTEAAAMPAAGSWMRGAFVKNTSPAKSTSGQVVHGWLRLTTGTGNVAGTDWGVVQSSNGAILQGTATYDPASLADAAGATTTVTVTGAALGDIAMASFSNALQGITLTAWVSAADTVSVRFQNVSGGVLDLASGTLKAWVFK